MNTTDNKKATYMFGDKGLRTCIEELGGGCSTRTSDSGYRIHMFLDKDGNNIAPYAHSAISDAWDWVYKQHGLERSK